MKVDEKNLAMINGGTDSLTGNLLNYFSKAISTVFEIGQNLGGAIRRIATNNTCPM